MIFSDFHSRSSVNIGHCWQTGLYAVMLRDWQRSAKQSIPGSQAIDVPHVLDREENQEIVPPY